MKRIIQITLIILAIFCALIFIAYYVFETTVKQQIIPNTNAFIKEQTQLNTSFKKFKFSFAKLLKFEPTIEIEDLNIEDAIYVKKIFIELYLKPLLKKKFEVKQIIIENLELGLQENAKHEVSVKGINVKKVAKALAENQKKSKSGKTSQSLVTDFQLNKLEIKNSTIRYYIFKSTKAFKIYPVNIELADLGYGENDQIISKLKFNAKLFNSRNSEISGSGTMGPFPLELNYIPIAGTETLSLYINDIPEADRNLLLGKLVMSNAKTQILQRSQFKGDLLSTIYGSGNAEIRNFMLGKSKEHYITANSTIPLSYVIRLNTNPNLKLESKNAVLNLTGTESMKGQISFNTYISYDLDTAFVEGSSHGKLRGLEIEESLNCFTDFRNLITGVFEINNYNVYFHGANAAQIGKSLKADGSIEIKDGSLYILKNITKYKDLAAAFIKNGDELTEKLSGQFITLTTNFDLKDGDLYTNDIVLKTDNLDIGGSGVIKAPEILDYNIFIKVRALKQIPIKIKGTIKKPRVIPDLQALGQQQGEQIVNTVLELGLGALKKYAEQNTKTINGATTTSTPIKFDKKKLKNLGNQLLKGIILEPKPTSPVPATSNGVL